MSVNLEWPSSSSSSSSTSRRACVPSLSPSRPSLGNHRAPSIDTVATRARLCNAATATRPTWCLHSSVLHCRHSSIHWVSPQGRSHHSLGMIAMGVWVWRRGEELWANSLREEKSFECKNYLWVRGSQTLDHFSSLLWFNGLMCFLGG